MTAFHPFGRRGPRWQPGHDLTLLENGEAFYPAVFAAIEQARHEVLVETFILFEDKVGLALKERLVAAAQRGATVDLLVDGFGSADLSEGFIRDLAEAGVHLRVFDPGRRWLGLRANWFRRMHRKLAVIDNEIAFVGGINFSADHLADFGPEAKQDYAMSLRGPLVDDIRRFMLGERDGRRGRPDGERVGPGAPAGPPGARAPAARRWFWQRDTQRPSPASPDAAPSANGADVLFVTRDNQGHHTDIERHYRIAIRAARERLWIANAYFFPGYRLLRDLRRAARRGVDVRLILQGEPDMQIVKTAAGLLYDHLARAGVKIYEYCERPLHGKVALADDRWSTVGSSNLDPLSLSLNLEANVVIRDRGFNETLAARLDHLMRHACKEVTVDESARPGFWQLARSVVVFHVLRRFPRWARWLPAHAPTVDSPTAQLRAASTGGGT